MKKIVTLGFVLVLFVTAASAQFRSDRYRSRPSVNGERFSRVERFQLGRDAYRYKTSRRRAERDGFVGPLERRKLHKMRMKTRYDTFRFRHNRRNRII